LPPLEVWERVFVSDADFVESTHGKVGCMICHQGDSTVAVDIAEDEVLSDNRIAELRQIKEAAHQDLVKDPAELDCDTCHSDIHGKNAISLHTTLSGFDNALQARGGDLSEGTALCEAFDNHCDSCHTTCGQCHVSRPDTSGGGLLSGHEFKKTPNMNFNCIACHGSRVGAEYKGENEDAGGESIAEDYHWTQHYTCSECHSDELHGSGQIAEHRYDNAVSAQCADCHADVWSDTDNAQHDQHVGDLSCQVCHSVEYKNCYNCHVSIGSNGAPKYETDESVMDFKIGLNPQRSPDRPYKYVVVRHVPVAPDTFSYYGDDLLPDFDDVSTWKYATPHAIQRNTPQNASCDSCHGQAELFLTEDDVAEDERAANQDVIVQTVPDPDI
jgi:hypothetical protein